MHVSNQRSFVVLGSRTRTHTLPEIDGTLVLQRPVEPVNLILHQRDERRDHQHRLLGCPRRYLVAQRLARTCDALCGNVG